MDYPKQDVERGTAPAGLVDGRFIIGICSDFVLDETDRLPIVENAVKVADSMIICDWIDPSAVLSAIGTDE
jgi:hypothetical protein